MKQQQQQRGSGYCRALCCSCRLSVSSSSEDHSSKQQQFPTISSLAHAMVQERLEQMIRQGQEEKEREQVEIRRRRKVVRGGGEQTKFVVMVAMEKSSYDPKEDFRESMEEMIMGNRIGEPKDLRCLLNYYLSMNDEEYHGVILQVFHDVCSNLFLRCKCH